MKRIIAWLRQPTTVAGVSTLGGTLLGIATGQLNWQGATPLIFGSLVGIVLPDNSAAVAAAQTLAKDTLATALAFHAANSSTAPATASQRPA